VVAERWLSIKATRSAKTVAGYRSLLDTVVLPQWRDVPLRDIRFDDLQVWITGLAVDGSVRFEGKGLSASRVRQAHQLVGAVLKFAVKARHLPANPANGVELPRLPEVEQRYLTHEQLHRVAVASGRLRTLVLVRLLATEIEGRDDGALVFTSARSGGHLILGQARYTFSKATGVVDGCGGVRIHDLRHTCASLAISAGANVKVVQKLLGHKSAVLTLDKYGHLFSTTWTPLRSRSTLLRAICGRSAPSKPLHQTETLSDLLVAGTGFEPV
jgi:site-specific recombinase XerD